MALSRLNENNTNPTFMYRFNFDSPTFNHFRIKQIKCGECRGVSHADDLPYIFRNQYVEKLEDIGEDERIVISRMMNLIYGFALNNEPITGEGVQWLPLKQQDWNNGQIKCLNVARNLSIIEMPEKERMHFWSSLYAKGYLI